MTLMTDVPGRPLGSSTTVYIPDRGILPTLRLILQTRDLARIRSIVSLFLKRPLSLTSILSDLQYCPKIIFLVSCPTNCLGILSTTASSGPMKIFYGRHEFSDRFKESKGTVSFEVDCERIRTPNTVFLL